MGCRSIRGFRTGTWATCRQWAELKSQVRKGERGTVILFYRKIERSAGVDASEEDRESNTRLVARASWVFNADQVDNWRPAELDCAPSAFKVIERAETFVRTVGADIHESPGVACYYPHADYILMPPRSAFTGTSTSNAAEGYYATLFHELTHWTGHKSRLDRDFSTRFGDEAYAMEELVAELGAAFLCATLGITNEPRPDHAAYVKNWLRVLGNDRRAIVIAAGKAGAAADYLRKHCYLAEN